MLLAEDLKDKKKKKRVRRVEKRKKKRKRVRASSSSRVARAIACRSNAPNLSIKTAVISTSTAMNNLMINYWQSPSLLPAHTFSLSVYLSVSPFSHSFSFPKIRHRLRHESCRPVFGSVTSDFAAGAMPPTPFAGYPLSLSLSTCLSSLSFHPLLLWHLPGRHRDPHISTHPPAQPRCRFYPAQLHVRE